MYFHRAPEPLGNRGYSWAPIFPPQFMIENKVPPLETETNRRQICLNHPEPDTHLCPLKIWVLGFWNGKRSENGEVFIICLAVKPDLISAHLSWKLPVRRWLLQFFIYPTCYEYSDTSLKKYEHVGVWHQYIPSCLYSGNHGIDTILFWLNL